MPVNIALSLQSVSKKYPPMCIQVVQRMVSLSISCPSAHPYRLGGLEALGTAVAACSVPPRLLSSFSPLLLLSSLFEPRLGRRAVSGGLRKIGSAQRTVVCGKNGNIHNVRVLDHAIGGMPEK